jgi:hypothetical protein
MELVDNSEPDAPKNGWLLAAVEYVPITSIYGESVMRAIEGKAFSGYGGLRQTELPKPQPATDRVLVRITAAGVTPLDYTILSGAHPRAKAPLVLNGKIDQWYSQQGRSGVVFILNVTVQVELHRFADFRRQDGSHSRRIDPEVHGPDRKDASRRCRRIRWLGQARSEKR